MYTISRDQAESSCAVQSKLDVILRISINQDKAVPEKNRKITWHKGRLCRVTS